MLEGVFSASPAHRRPLVPETSGRSAVMKDSSLRSASRTACVAVALGEPVILSDRSNVRGGGLVEQPQPAASSDRTTGATA